MDKERTSTNGLEDKKAKGETLGISSEKLHRLYVLRKEKSRALKDNMDTSIKLLEVNIKESKGSSISMARKRKTESIKINIIKPTRKQKLKEKQLYGYFKRQTDNISSEKTGIWLRKRNL